MTRPPSYEWIKPGTARSTREAAEIICEHGAVSGCGRYAARHQARYRAQKLIGLLVELGLFERFELREHTNRTREGWVWSVQCVEWRGAHTRNVPDRSTV